MGIRINCVFGEIYQKSIQAGATLGTTLPPPKLDTLWLEGIRVATNCKGVASHRLYTTHLGFSWT